MCVEARIHFLVKLWSSQPSIIESVVKICHQSLSFLDTQRSKFSLNTQYFFKKTSQTVAFYVGQPGTQYYSKKNY